MAAIIILAVWGRVIKCKGSVPELRNTDNIIFFFVTFNCYIFYFSFREIENFQLKFFEKKRMKISLHILRIFNNYFKYYL